MSDNEPIDFACPQCQKKLRVPANAVGKSIRCPNSSNVVAEPAETGTTAEPPKLRPQPRPPEPEPEPDSYEEPSRDDDEDDYRERRWPRIERHRSAGGAFMAAAICLLMVAGLGLAFDLFGVCFAVLAPEQPINPQDPPLVQEIQNNLHGPVASAGQGFFALLSAVTIIGSIQMLRQKTWGFALAACLLSMVNVGNCCCVLGLPVGIWGLILLLSQDVKDRFS